MILFDVVWLILFYFFNLLFKQINFLNGILLYVAKIVFAKID